jgi:hypothetical protein
MIQEQGRINMIHLLHTRATPNQLTEMLQELRTYIKLAVDIERGILSGGGAMHADCEAILIAEGCKQPDIWGADWVPDSQEVRFESLINIRPRHNNPSMTILDPAVRDRVEKITKQLLGGV